MGEGATRQSLPARLFSEWAAMMRFYSHLPLPAMPFERDAHAAPDFRNAVRTLPLAALCIALPGALMLDLAAALWLPPLLVALVAIAVSLIVTGALHEDGLADFCDGIGGGATRERRLEIMRDSRIGTYGAAALIVVIGIRAAALAAILDRQGAPGTMLAFVAAAIVSRVAALLPHWLLPAARPDGRAADVGQPGTVAVSIAAALTIALVLLLLHGFGLTKLGFAFMLAGLAAATITLIAKARLGGHTGDVIGAAQQMAEVAFLTALTASFYR